MHEYSLADALLDQLETIRDQQAAERVVGVHVRVGQFAGVEPDLLREAFAMQTQDRWGYPVDFTMDIVPLEASCDECGHSFSVVDFEFQCPKCRSGNVTVLRGEELILDNLTLEQNSPTERTPAP